MVIDFLQAKKWLIDILRIDSVQSEGLPNMPFGEGNRRCLDYSLKLLSDLGFATKDLEGYCGYGEVGKGELFGILCHLDVVPVSGKWKFPPFSATEYDNKIYARGALDDKGPFISALYAVARLLDEGFTPTKRIRFILGCNEESGWGCMDRYVKTEEMPVMGISPDSDFPVINCEKGIVYHSLSHQKPYGIISIRGGERANMVPDYAVCEVKATEKIMNAVKNSDCEQTLEEGIITIKTYGKSAHGSHPEEGDNAIYKLLKILGAEYGIFEKMYDAFVDKSGKNVGLDINDDISGGHTHNLGVCRLVGDTMEYQLDVRHPITYTKEQITEILTKNLPFVTVKQGFFHLPLYVPKEHKLVQALLGAYNSVMGVNAEPITIGGGTYARVLPLGVAFGPVFPDSGANIHCVDENIDLDEFRLSAEIYYQALKKLCF